MFLYLTEYYTIFIYFFLIFFLALIIIGLAKILAPQYFNIEKLSAYECGFEPFMSARIKFDVSFAIIAILFLVFDLEIIFLIPWAIHFMELGLLGLVVMYIFLFLLILGFIFELFRNTLDWEKDFS